MRVFNRESNQDLFGVITPSSYNINNKSTVHEASIRTQHTIGQNPLFPHPRRTINNEIQRIATNNHLPRLTPTPLPGPITLKCQQTRVRFRPESGRGQRCHQRWSVIHYESDYTFS